MSLMSIIVVFIATLVLPKIEDLFYDTYRKVTKIVDLDNDEYTKKFIDKRRRKKLANKKSPVQHRSTTLLKRILRLYFGDTIYAELSKHVNGIKFEISNLHKEIKILFA